MSDVIFNNKYQENNNKVFQEDIFCNSCSNIHAIAFVDSGNKNIIFYPMVFIGSNKKCFREYRIKIKQVTQTKKYSLMIRCPLCNEYTRFNGIPMDWTFRDGTVEMLGQFFCLNEEK